MLDAHTGHDRCEHVFSINCRALLTCSTDAAGARECVRFLPPLNVKATEIDEALERLEGSLQEVFKSDSKTS